MYYYSVHSESYFKKTMKLNLNLLFLTILCAHGLGNEDNVSSNFINKREGKSVVLSSLDGLTRRLFIDRDKLPGEFNNRGQKCILKIIQVPETVYERGMQCQHSFKKKCHLTHFTDYVSSPEKKCETTFKKNCHITFKAVPHKEKVKKCRTPLVQKCQEGTPGPEICSIHYETLCGTRYKNYELEQDEPVCEKKEELRCKNVTVNLLHIPHDDTEGNVAPFAVKEECEKWPIQRCTLTKKNVKKVHPKTECKKQGRKICSPNNCISLPGPEVCYEEVQIQIQNIPQEECDLEPEENCRIETSLVPKLTPTKNCVKVPKEICVNTKKNPKKIMKPIAKLWCYDPYEIKKVH